MGNTKTRQAINYDVGRTELEDKIGLSKAIKVSTDLIQYFKANGFEKTGESAFTSIKPMTQAKANNIIADIHTKVENAEESFNSFHLTSVTNNIYDFTKFANEHPSEKSLADINKDYNIDLKAKNNVRRSIRFDMPEADFNEGIWTFYIL